MVFKSFIWDLLLKIIDIFQSGLKAGLKVKIKVTIIFFMNLCL